MLAKHQLPPSVTTAFRRRPSPSDQPKPTQTDSRPPPASSSGALPSDPPTPSPQPPTPQTRAGPRTEKAKLRESWSPHHQKDEGMRTQVSGPPAPPHEKRPQCLPSEPFSRSAPHGSLLAFLFRVEPNFRGFKKPLCPHWLYSRVSAPTAEK